MPRSCEQQREEVDLEEQVAELVEQLRVVIGERRVGDLVGLLDRVRDDRLAPSARDPTGSRGADAPSALQLEQGLGQALHVSVVGGRGDSSSVDVAGRRRSPPGSSTFLA